MILLLLLLFVILQIVDSLTTIHILKNGKELNPVLAWLFDKIGIVTTLIIIKTLAILLVFAAWNEYLTVAIDVWYLGVVGWNSHQIIKGK